MQKVTLYGFLFLLSLASGAAIAAEGPGIDAPREGLELFDPPLPLSTRDRDLAEAQANSSRPASNATIEKFSETYTTRYAKPSTAEQNATDAAEKRTHYQYKVHNGSGGGGVAYDIFKF